jgi:hypothetical protein
VGAYRKKVRPHTTTAILYGTDPATCPVRARRAYLNELAAVGRTDGPLFVRVDRWGRPTPEAAADVVERLAVAAGHDPLEIARQGGWADGSRILARYMAEVDRVTNSPLVGSNDSEDKPNTNQSHIAPISAG